MALVTDLTTDQAKIDLLEKSIKIRDRYGDPRMDKKDVVWRKRNYKDFQIESQIDSAALLWDVQADDTRALWNAAGAACGLTGYQLWLQDIGFRLLNNLPGIPVPSTFHQYKVLRYDLGAVAEYFQIYQYHPKNYSLRVPIVGKKNAEQVVAITETVTSPLVIEFDYKANLEWTPGASMFRLWVQVQGTKSGAPKTSNFYLALEEQTDWIHAVKSCVLDFDTISGYFVIFDGSDYSGFFDLDNIVVEHSGQNWAYDPRCEDVKAFKRYSSGAWRPYWTSNGDAGYDGFASEYID